MGPSFGPLMGISILIISAQHLPVADSANIVFFFGLSSYSHRIPAWPLAEGLAEKGHNVTFISPYPAKTPNPKILDYVPKTLKEWVDNWDEMQNDFGNRKNGQGYLDRLELLDFGITMCEEIYKDEEYVKWIKSAKVDLVFLDGLVNDCAYGKVHYWGAKVILFQTTAPFAHFTDAYGLPDETGWIPTMDLFYPLGMSFQQRLTNALVPLVWNYYRSSKFFPRLEEITREKLGIEALPKFEEIERNTSMIFLNTHYGEEFARALPPNTISIGGIASSGKRKLLPRSLDAFLEKGDGFIYISFGTYTDFLNFDKPIQEAFIGAMKRFPQLQFVWKLGNDSFAKEFPQKNVYISNWMPQQDILAHPKIKAFITHSGLLGIQEAIQNAVPLISFPIFAEQDYNAERIHRKEHGIRLEITTVTETQLEVAITEILTHPKYRDNMGKISTLFKERPQKPLEAALWWTEFVLRHSQEDLSALRSGNVGQAWWKRRQLDVWATIIGTLVGLMLSMSYLIYKLLTSAFPTNAIIMTTQIKSSKRKKLQ